MPREFRKIERSPAQTAEIKAIRERFQRDKPTRKQLEASGECGPGMPTAVYFEVKALLHRLRQAREAANLSLADVAERTGMDKSALSRLETGQGNPTLDTLARYAAALGKRLVFGMEEAGAA
jgi:DNA-binding phage protein